LLSVSTAFKANPRFPVAGVSGTPYAEEEAKKEIEALITKYPFVSEFRVITRKIE